MLARSSVGVGRVKSFPNNFNKHTLSPPAVEFTIENLLPWTEIEVSICDRDEDFTPHDLAFYVRICIIFACIIMAILIYRLVWREFLQPLFVILNSNSHSL